MSLMWMPPQTTVPPLRTAASAVGTRLPTGAKISAASSSSRGRRVGVAGPGRTHRAREVLGCRVAGAGEGEQLAALVARDLRHDVGGGAEAVDAEPAGVAGHAQRAPADQAGAEQRCGLGVAVAVGQWESRRRRRRR